MNDYVRLSILSTVLLLASAAPSYAYLDPGTASMALQAIIGGIAAGAATIGLYWTKIKSFFISRRAAKSE